MPDEKKSAGWAFYFAYYKTYIHVTLYSSNQ